MSETTNPAEDATAQDATAQDATAQDAKAKFREALARKQGKRHPHEAATQGEAKVGDTHGAVGGKRTFRRKSGG